MQKTTPPALGIANSGVMLAEASSERDLPLPILSFADTPHLSRVVKGFIFVFRGGGLAVRGGNLSLGRLKTVHANLFDIILTKLSSAKRTEAMDKLEVPKPPIEELDEQSLFSCRSR